MPRHACRRPTHRGSIEMQGVESSHASIARVGSSFPGRVWDASRHGSSQRTLSQHLPAEQPGSAIG